MCLECVPLSLCHGLFVRISYRHLNRALVACQSVPALGRSRKGEAVLKSTVSSARSSETHLGWGNRNLFWSAVFTINIKNIQILCYLATCHYPICMGVHTTAKRKESDCLEKLVIFFPPFFFFLLCNDLVKHALNLECWSCSSQIRGSNWKLVFLLWANCICSLGRAGGMEGHIH